ncbi:MAG: AAA family ATPase [Bryobacter sp.]|nr:AAA family ATPase [Bryobacter sp.]
MIDHLEVHNYKMFERLRLDGLGRINLIVGKNNVGKTSLLEIGYLATSPYKLHALDQILKLRHANLDEGILTILKKFGPATASALLRHFEISFPGGVFQITDIPKNILIHGNNDYETKLTEQRAVLNKLPGAAFVPSSGIDPWELDRYWDILDLTGNKGLVTEALRLALPEIEAFGLVRASSGLREPHVRLRGQKEFEVIHSLGEGMHRISGLSLGLLFAQDGYLFIDEIENGLHYTLHEQICDFLFAAATQLNVQVFLTTHSLDFTRAFARSANKTSEVGRLYRLDKTFGPIEAIPYTEEEMYIAAEQNIEVR